MKTILFNDTKVDSSAETVDHFITEQKIDRVFVAVIVNDAIISRDEWNTTHLKNGDKVDVYTPVGGG